MNDDQRFPEGVNNSRADGAANSLPEGAEKPQPAGESRGADEQGFRSVSSAQNSVSSAQSQPTAVLPTNSQQLPGEHRYPTTTDLGQRAGSPHTVFGQSNQPPYGSQQSRQPFSGQPYQGQAYGPQQSRQTYAGPAYPGQPTNQSAFGNNAPLGYYGPTRKEEAKTQHKDKKRPGWKALVACSALAALVGGGIGIGGTYALQDSSPRYVSSAPSEGGTTPVVSSKADAPDWAAVADAVGDSVVSIQVSSESAAGEGSGVIIDKEGYILTNDHVVADAKQVYVTLADGRVFEAKVIGSDPATDLAVIQLAKAPDNLTIATLGDSSSVGVGDPVAAIGNPMGLASTLTTGVVSALDRPTAPTSGDGAVTNAIQIDAAINPGNSGGPVFNSSGQVVGIASSIVTTSSAMTTSGGSIGLGFAIPINLAKNVATQLIENGVAEHAYLGVTIRAGIAAYDGQSRTGAEVADVQPQTPAAAAGLKTGDVVTRINDKAVGSSISLTGYVRQFRSGDVVTLQLVRDGKLMEVDVTLATKPDNFG